MKGKISTNQIVIPVITGLIANLLFLLLSAIISYFVVIQPMLSDVKEKVEHSFEHICIIEDKIENIERNYLVKDVEGQKCVIGVSANTEKGSVGVYNDNKFNLENGDIISLVRTDGPYAPTLVSFVVYVNEKGANVKPSDADLFLNREGIERLGMSYGEIVKKGLVKNLKIKFYRKHANSNDVDSK